MGDPRQAPRRPRAENLEQLAAQLGRPATGLAALRRLTPEQVGLLSDSIERLADERRNAVDASLSGLGLAPARGALLRLLRR